MQCLYNIYLCTFCTVFTFDILKRSYDAKTSVFLLILRRLHDFQPPIWDNNNTIFWKCLKFWQAHIIFIISCNYLVLTYVPKPDQTKVRSAIIYMLHIHKAYCTYYYIHTTYIYQLMTFKTLHMPIIINIKYFHFAINV